VRIMIMMSFARLLRWVGLSIVVRATVFRVIRHQLVRKMLLLALLPSMEDGRWLLLFVVFLIVRTQLLLRLVATTTMAGLQLQLPATLADGAPLTPQP
jgi:hypothetical protein